MIESRGLNQGDVVSGRPILKMFSGVSPGIVDLREPFAQIDAVSEMSGAALRERRIGLGERTDRKQRDQQGNEFVHVSVEFPVASFGQAGLYSKLTCTQLAIGSARIRFLVAA